MPKFVDDLQVAELAMTDMIIFPKSQRHHIGIVLTDAQGIRSLPIFQNTMSPVDIGKELAQCLQNHQKNTCSLSDNVLGKTAEEGGIVKRRQSITQSKSFSKSLYFWLDACITDILQKGLKEFPWINIPATVIHNMGILLEPELKQSVRVLKDFSRYHGLILISSGMIDNHRLYLTKEPEDTYFDLSDVTYQLSEAKYVWD
jgi:hypothetical protein